MNGLCVSTSGEVSRQIDGMWVDVDPETFDDPAEADLVIRIWDCQGLNTSRTRIAYFGGKAVAETEFREFIDEVEFWDEIKAKAEKYGLIYDLMDESTHLDHYSRPDPYEGAIPDPNEPGWFFGPNHGRPERHVALQYELPEGFNKDTASVAKFHLEVLTQKFWDKAGNGLL